MKLTDILIFISDQIQWIVQFKIMKNQLYCLHIKYHSYEVMVKVDKIGINFTKD